MKKLAAVCALVLIIGLVFAGAGYALGGVKGLDKVSEKHDWIMGSPGERSAASKDAGRFNAVEAEGDADIFLVTKECFENENWLQSFDLLSGEEAAMAKEGSVVVIKGEKAAQPEITNEDGLLKIKAKPRKQHGLSLNFSKVSWNPVILVCCPQETLKSVSIKVDTGDVVLDGISYKKLTLNSDTGDIVMKNVTGSSQKIKCDTGDVSVTGDLTGTTDIQSDTGDVLFTTNTPIADVNMDLACDTGDIVISSAGNVVKEIEDSPSSYTQQGGRDTLTIKTDTGDITVICGE